MGFEVTVSTSDVGSPAGDRIESRVSIEAGTLVRRFRYILPQVFRKTNLLITPQMWLQSLVDGNPPDLIHLHDFRSFQAVCAFILASRCRVPLVLQPHGTLQVALGKVREKKTYDIVVGRRILR